MARTEGSALGPAYSLGLELDAVLTFGGGSHECSVLARSSGAGRSGQAWVLRTRANPSLLGQKEQYLRPGSHMHVPEKLGNASLHGAPAHLQWASDRLVFAPRR